MGKKNNSKEKASAPTAYREIDLTLPEGEWWRPWEDGDIEIEVVLLRLRKGEFGEYFVARDLDGNTLFINCHAMLEGLKKAMNRIVKITYDGKDETRGRNGVHMYRAAMAVGRAGAGPNRPARPNREETEEEADNEAEA